MAADRPPPGPRALAHRGSIEASGLLFDEGVVSIDTIYARAAARWAPGSALRRLPGGRWWLRFAAPARLDAGAAEGAPLALEQGLHCAAPGLGPAARGLGAADGSLALLSGGEPLVFGPHEGEAVEASSLLDLGDFSVSVASGPRASPREARGLVASRADVRAVLGKIPPADPQASEVAAALQRGESLPSLEGPAEPHPAVRWLAGLFRVLSAALTRLMVSRGSGPLGRAASASAARSSQKGEARGLVVRRVDPSGPGWAERAAARLNDLAARLMMASGLAARVGKKQANYLGNMMQMFERGDLDQALRHAIPLGRGGGGGASFTLGAPTPRGELSLSTGSSSSGSSVLPFAGLHDELKRLYRAAFERLDAEGRVEEAAFVLAELLGESDEAVAYLERHGKLRLAAELAEGRGLSPGLVVRQWWIAGEHGRALLLARRHQVFADAILRLERGEAGQADAHALRALWADALASAGDLLGAERALRDVPGSTPLRLAWLARACELGGPAAHEAWVRRLSLEPGCFDAAAAALGPTLRDPAPEAALDRLALAEVVAASPDRSAPLRALARPLLRAMLADAGRDRAEHGALVRLRDLFAEGALRVDWPAGEAHRPSLPLAIDLPESSRGSVPLLDAAVLPAGRFLVALGEAGALLLSREGKTLHHFDQPASSLVLSTHGDRALALAPRGRFTRVARLDLAGRRSQPWAEVELSCWAGSFDGSGWLVGQRQGLLEIDALADGWSALWQVRSVEGTPAVCQLSDDGAELRAAVEGADGLSLWVFDASARVLRRRVALLPPSLGRPSPPLLALAGDGALRWDEIAPLALLQGTSSPVPLAGTAARGGDGVLVAHRGKVAMSAEDVCFFHTISGQQLAPLAQLRLAGARRVAARMTPHGAAVADDTGRLLHLQLGPSPSLVRALRV